MKKILKSGILSFMAITLAVSGVSIVSASSYNTRITVAMNASRNANNLVTFIPTAWRHGADEEHAVEVWPTGNVVTVTNGVSTNTALWGTSYRSTHRNPTIGSRLTSSTRTHTIRQGHVQSNARVRRSSMAAWSSTVTIRRSWN